MMKVEYVDGNGNAAATEVDADGFLIEDGVLFATKGDYGIFAVPVARLVAATLTPPAVANPTEAVNRLPALDAA